MPKTNRLILLGALLLSAVSAGPIITAYDGTTLHVSDTYAHASDGVGQYGDFDNDYYFVWHYWSATGTPFQVSAGAGSSLDEGDSDDVYDWISDFWAEATVTGELKIIGGSGMAYVDFLVGLIDACADFSPLGVQHSQCGYTPPGELLAIPFRFNEPFEYHMQATAYLPGTEGFNSSEAILNGIVVRDASGRVLSGAQLVPGDFPVPDDAVPEPSTWLLTAAGGALLAWRSHRR